MVRDGAACRAVTTPPCTPACPSTPPHRPTLRRGRRRLFSWGAEMILVSMRCSTTRSHSNPICAGGGALGWGRAGRDCRRRHGWHRRTTGSCRSREPGASDPPRFRQSSAVGVPALRRPRQRPSAHPRTGATRPRHCKPRRDPEMCERRREVTEHGSAVKPCWLRASPGKPPCPSAPRSPVAHHEIKLAAVDAGGLRQGGVWKQD